MCVCVCVTGTKSAADLPLRHEVVCVLAMASDIRDESDAAGFRDHRDTLGAEGDRLLSTPQHM